MIVIARGGTTYSTPFLGRPLLHVLQPQKTEDTSASPEAAPGTARRSFLARNGPAHTAASLVFATLGALCPELH